MLYILKLKYVSKNVGKFLKYKNKVSFPHVRPMVLNQIILDSNQSDDGWSFNSLVITLFTR